MQLKWICILTPLLALASLVGAGAQQAPDHSMSGQMNMPMNGGQMTMEMPRDGAGNWRLSADDSSAYDVGNKLRAELYACADADEDERAVDADVSWERVSGGAAADESSWRR